MLATGKSLKSICGGVWKTYFCSVLGLVKLSAFYVKMKCPALFTIWVLQWIAISTFLGEPWDVQLMTLWLNAQLLELHIVTPKLPSRKVPRVF